MSRGETRFVLPVTADMAGTLEIRAYKILPNEDIIRDSRTLVIGKAPVDVCGELRDCPAVRGRAAGGAVGVPVRVAGWCSGACLTRICAWLRLLSG